MGYNSVLWIAEILECWLLDCFGAALNASKRFWSSAVVFDAGTFCFCTRAQRTAQPKSGLTACQALSTCAKSRRFPCGWLPLRVERELRFTSASVCCWCYRVLLVPFLSYAALIHVEPCSRVGCFSWKEMSRCGQEKK